MHRHQERSIRKRPFDLNIMDGNLDARHDVSPSEHLLAELHELCHAVLAIADELLQLESQECNRFRLIKLKASGESLLSEEAQVGEQELVLKRRIGAIRRWVGIPHDATDLLPWRESHD